PCACHHASRDPTFATDRGGAAFGCDRGTTDVTTSTKPPLSESGLNTTGIDVHDATPSTTDAHFDPELKAALNPGSAVVAPSPAKSGGMIRETLDAGSRHVGLLATPAAGVRFLRRRETGGPTTNAVKTDNRAITPPCWLRLDRKGDTITAWRSADCIDWQLIG